MAIVVHSTADVTVNTISDRNSIAYKRDNMTVTVIDAIADIDAGQGVAIYRWNTTLSSWILISKSTTETISFATEEIAIVNGTVMASNIPVDDIIWDIVVVNGGIIKAELTLNSLTISLGNISGLSEYNGSALRFSYAYGSITQQLNAVLKTKSNTIDVGAIVDFEGGLI